jgi:hypothetical protein
MGVSSSHHQHRSSSQLHSPAAMSSWRSSGPDHRRCGWRAPDSARSHPAPARSLSGGSRLVFSCERSFRMNHTAAAANSRTTAPIITPQPVGRREARRQPADADLRRRDAPRASRSLRSWSYRSSVVSQLLQGVDPLRFRPVQNGDKAGSSRSILSSRSGARSPHDAPRSPCTGRTELKSPSSHRYCPGPRPGSRRRPSPTRRTRIQPGPPSGRSSRWRPSGGLPTLTPPPVFQHSSASVHPTATQVPKGSGRLAPSKTGWWP